MSDLLDTEGGKGVMSVLAADRLMLNPRLYSTFLMWLMTELYDRLPEVGDPDLPKLVFFFDEAHMLFDGTSKALVDKLEQVIRLIRSKGVGIYFITQSPTDIPDTILAQLSNRVQHALRAFTPKDQKDVRAAAETFRANPDFQTAEAIMNLETGEALVSFLDEKGAPSVVERARMLFPLSQIGAVTEGQRIDVQNAAPARIKAYAQAVDSESAYETLSAQNAEEAAAKEAERQAKEEAKAQKEAEKEAARQAKEQAKAERESQKKSSWWKKGIIGAIISAILGTLTRSIGTTVSDAVTGKKSKSTSKKSAGTDILGKVTKNVTTTATRKISEEVLKNIFK